MTHAALLEALFAWREARQRAYDRGGRGNMDVHYRNAIEELTAAVDAYRAAHPGGSDPLCDCPACRLGTGRGLAHGGMIVMDEAEKCQPKGYGAWHCAKCGKAMQFSDGLCFDCYGGDPGQ